MNQTYARINSIDSEYFGEGLYTIYSPASFDSANIDYYILTQFNNSVSKSDIQNLRCNLINTKTGAVHSIKDTAVIGFEGESDFKFKLTLTSETTEDDNVNCLELSFKLSTEGGIQDVTSRIEIKVKKIKEAISTFNYKLGNISIIDSNLLSPRVKLGFANWSTVHKNDVSNASKLLEPLHQVFTNSFTKSNELLKQTFDLNYTPATFSRIFLHGYPLNIIRKVEGTSEELKETDDIFSSIHKVEISDSEDGLSLTKVYLSTDIENNRSKLERLDLPTVLYARKLNSNTQVFCECVVKGFDKFQNPITESIILRSDLYTQLQNTYERITNIYYGNNDIEISTYVDLRYHHYIISHPYIIPPIVDKNFTTFKPHPVIKTNQELDRNTLVINNGLTTAGIEEYKLSFGTDIDVPIISLFITEELDVLYNTPIPENNDYTLLNYSKLRIDYTKDIFNDKTLNNNRYIVVSDSKTSIGDWVDVTINTQEWFKYIDQKSLLLRVRNNNTVLYYNQETGELVEDKVYFYSDLASTDSFEISVNVENNLPYIFSIVSEDNITVSAMSCIDTIDSYYSEEVNSKSMIHYNGEVRLVSFNDLDYEHIGYEDKLTLTVAWSNYSTLDYKIQFNDGYFISNDGSNLNPDFYRLVLPENNIGGPVVIELDRDALTQLNSGALSFQVGLSFNTSNGLLTGQEFANLLITNSYVGSLNVPITPEQQYTPTHKMQYTININPDGSIYSEEIE